MNADVDVSAKRKQSGTPSFIVPVKVAQQLNAFGVDKQTAAASVTSEETNRSKFKEPRGNVVADLDNIKTYSIHDI